MKSVGKSNNWGSSGMLLIMEKLLAKNDFLSADYYRRIFIKYPVCDYLNMATQIYEDTVGNLNEVTKEEKIAV